MINITIIGTGNVAWHLARGIKKSEHLKLLEIVGRSPDIPDYLEEFPYSTELSENKKCDILLLCLPDEILEIYSKKLKDLNTLVLHTSGSTPLSTLEKLNNYGVLYPLQTLTKGKVVSLQEIPFLIEANTADNLKLIYELAQHLSKTVLEMNSEERAHLHFAAVLANNFSNHILLLTQEYCKQNKVPFNLLNSLVAETFKKAFELGPQQAQTGPARRGDYITIEKQIKRINNPFLKTIYKNLTDSILNTYGRKKL